MHVPVFLDKIGEHFETTRFAIEDALKFHKKNKLSPQLEIETYTWDVLPDSMKTGSIVDYVERELDWVQGQLGVPALEAQRRKAMKVGFIGLGRMGQAMAARLLGGGHELVVYNRSREKAAELEKNGAKVAGSIAEACRGREVVISMVADDKALTEVVKEISGALDKGAIHVAMGTHGVHVLREVDAVHGKAGQKFVASPVLGRPEAAAAGQINIVPAGPADAIEKLAPLNALMGRRTFPAGDEARRRRGREAREQHADRLRDRGDGRGVLARAQVRRRSGRRSTRCSRTACSRRPRTRSTATSSRKSSTTKSGSRRRSVSRTRASCSRPASPRTCRCRA